MSLDALVFLAAYGVAPLVLFGLTYGLLRQASRLASWAAYVAVVLAVFAIASSFGKGAILVLMSVLPVAGAFVPLAVPSLHAKPWPFLALGWGCFMAGAGVTFMAMLAISGGGGI